MLLAWLLPFCICIFSQLFYDGFQSLAVSLSSAVQAHPTCPPSDRLNHIVQLGLQHEHSMLLNGKQTHSFVLTS